MSITLTQVDPFDSNLKQLKKLMVFLHDIKVAKQLTRTKTYTLVPPVTGPFLGKKSLITGLEHN